MRAVVMFQSIARRVRARQEMVAHMQDERGMLLALPGTVQDRRQRRHASENGIGDLTALGSR